MKLPEMGVNRPVLTLMLFIAILVLGFISLQRLPLDLMPEMDFPSVTIITSYPGAGPEDVERNVTEVIESAVGTVSNLKQISSTSKENLSIVTLQFNWGTDIDIATMDVREKVDPAKPWLPDDAGDPLFLKFDMSEMPIFFLGLSAEESYPELYDIAERKIAEPLTRVPGVGTVAPMGGLVRQINVEVDKNRLEGMGLTLTQVIDILGAENLNTPVADLQVGRQSFLLRVPGEFEHVDDIRRVIVGSHNGIPIRLEEVAEIKDSFRDPPDRVWLDSKPGVMVIVQKQSGANTVAVANAVRKELERLEGDLPSDVELKVVMDSSEFITDSLTHLTKTILWGGLLVIGVVLVFLRNIRGSLIIAATIPFSLIIAFIFLFAAKFTINMVTLSSLAIAIGMVVDNAIVVMENIYRKREEGESLSQAAILGSSEVGQAILASTMTTVAIFLPLFFVSGFVGIMFRPLGFVIIAVLLGSLFTALTLTPMLSSRFLRVRSHNPGGGSASSLGWFQGIETVYMSILHWAIRHRPATLAVGLLVFLLTIVALRMGIVKTEMFPTEDQGEVRASLEMPVGTDVEATAEATLAVQRIVNEKVPERTVSLTRCGQSEAGFFSFYGGGEGPHLGSIWVQIGKKATRERSASEIAYDLNQFVGDIPGIQRIEFSDEDPMSQTILGGGKPISIEIYGEDLALTDSLAKQIRQMVEGINGTVNVSVSRTPGKPELRILIDREKASAMGLNMATVAMTLRTAFYGEEASVFRRGDDEYDIFVRFREEDRSSPQDLMSTMIPTPYGSHVQLANIAQLEATTGPLDIERKNRERIVKVEAGLYGAKMSEVIPAIQSGLAQIAVPEGITIKLSGEFEEQMETFGNLLFTMILGVLLVYMVMASQFESLIDPFIVMFTVPFAIVGVVLALLITGKTLNVMSYLGMIMLVGIVVNNAIVLIDYTNILRKRGLSVRDAVLSAGRRRLRPVIMTALTTTFGLLPLALMRGEGSESWNPLGIAVIGGLLISTSISLVFVPTLYSMIEDRLEKRAQRCAAVATDQHGLND